MTARSPLLRLPLTGNPRRLRRQWCDEWWNITMVRFQCGDTETDTAVPVYYGRPALFDTKKVKGTPKIRFQILLLHSETHTGLNFGALALANSAARGNENSKRKRDICISDRRIILHLSKRAGGHDSQGVKVSDRGWPCNESEPSTTKDSPNREPMHVKSVASSNVLPLVWCGS
ncbi:hypothetical protein TNCV_3517711 [Trichonephila clavipes]|nr:hypothetical protein TNCV_3517711 [Trichonephila clavipes]